MGELIYKKTKTYFGPSCEKQNFDNLLLGIVDGSDVVYSRLGWSDF